MVRVITETLKTPYAIRKAIVNSLREPELKFTYILQKDSFLSVLSKNFAIDEASAEAEGIFKIFKVAAPHGI